MITGYSILLGVAQEIVLDARQAHASSWAQFPRKREGPASQDRDAFWGSDENRYRDIVAGTNGSILLSAPYRG
jgi:hypothetical protein